MIFLPVLQSVTASVRGRPCFLSRANTRRKGRAAFRALYKPHGTTILAKESAPQVARRRLANFDGKQNGEGRGTLCSTDHMSTICRTFHAPTSHTGRRLPHHLHIAPACFPVRKSLSPMAPAPSLTAARITPGCSFRKPFAQTAEGADAPQQADGSPEGQY